MLARLRRRLQQAASSETAFFALLYGYTAVAVALALLERRRKAHRRG